MTLKFWRTTCFKTLIVGLLLSGLSGIAWAQKESGSSQAVTSDATTKVPIKHTDDRLYKSAVEIEPQGSGKVSNPSETAKKILSDKNFIDRGDLRNRNWFTHATENVGRAISKWLEEMFKRQQAPAGISLISPAVTVLFWALIIAAILAFLYFALKNFAWGASSRFRKRTVGGLLDEDEPDRTADEWLERADALAAKGEHRQAVRCLYLACLVRIDEANIARFIRAQTNWEHLRRIEDSPRRPANLDFRPTTQHFDEVWYGFKVKGESDVQQFRAFYVDLMKILGESIAA